MYIEGSTEALSVFPYLVASSLANPSIQRNGLQGAVSRGYRICTSLLADMWCSQTSAMSCPDLKLAPWILRNMMVSAVVDGSGGWASLTCPSWQDRLVP